MRILPAALLATLPFAAPALAQQDVVTYDADAVTACLSAATDDGQRWACIGQASDGCMAAPGGASTVGMTQCLGHERADWDRLLNDNYAKLVAQTKDSDAGNAQPVLPALQAMQRDWIAFRDASCTFAALQFQGGTAAGPAGESCLLQLTGEQALRLGSSLGDTP
ncbi:lysozyme inhibitor LprI family protein [Paracoccus shanxieyensis]|nr:lysozyme inhibitor LprI family protein [Paracoccus shanxieyensis]